MTTKIKIAITSLITLMIAVASPFNVSAVSNEIGTFKETVFVNVLRDSNNQNNIIDGTSGNWGRITSNYKYGLRINLRRTGGNNAFPFEEGDIIDISYVLVNSSYLTSSTAGAPTQPTCLNSSWIFTVVDCKIHMAVVSDVEYRANNYRISMESFQSAGGVDWFYGGNISEIDHIDNMNNINVYYFQYRLRYTGQGESRDNIILYGTFTNGQPWWLQFNETISISSSLAQGAIQANEQQKQEGQQAQQGGQQSGDSSQQSVEGSTQSLLSAITGFVGVISNATPTNCRITGDMGALDLGELDFCQDNPPAIIATIGTLILIAITIPITIWVVKKIISMFRSFTDG